MSVPENPKTLIPVFAWIGQIADGGACGDVAGEKPMSIESCVQLVAVNRSSCAYVFDDDNDDDACVFRNAQNSHCHAPLGDAYAWAAVSLVLPQLRHLHGGERRASPLSLLIVLLTRPACAWERAVHPHIAIGRSHGAGVKSFVFHFRAPGVSTWILALLLHVDSRYGCQSP